MPVIRGRPSMPAATPERRAQLQARLEAELSGPGTADGPLIFEMPRDQSDQVDVIIIWDEFEGVRADDRDGVIFDAYGERRDQLGMVTGASRREAGEQSLLPYLVRPAHCPFDEELRQLMIAEGALVGDDGKLELRLPSESMAIAAVDHLRKHAPETHWEVVRTASSDVLLSY